MKVILGKKDIESIVKKYFDMESVAWQKDGTIILDTTLEKITNEKNDLSKFNNILGINKKIIPYIRSQYPPHNSTLPRGTLGVADGPLSNVKRHLTKASVK